MDEATLELTPAHEELKEYKELRQTLGMETSNGELHALLFARHFATLPDPRRRTPQHPLLSILFIVLAAQLCGVRGGMQWRPLHGPSRSG